MYVCLCKSVTDHQIRAAVRAGADTLGALQERLDLGTNCGKCIPCAAEVLRAALRQEATPCERPGYLPVAVPAFA